MKIDPVVSYFKWKHDLEMPFMKFHRDILGQIKKTVQIASSFLLSFNY